MKKEDPSAPYSQEIRPEVYETSVHPHAGLSSPLLHYDQDVYDAYSQDHYGNIDQPYVAPAQTDDMMLSRECRLCLESGGEALIAPCSCRGTMKFVHRSCLDRWRALSPKAQSFYRCDQCLDYYQFIEMPNRLSNARYLKYFLFVTMDILFFLFLWQVAVVICSLTAAAIDLLIFKGKYGAFLGPLAQGLFYYAYGNGAFFFLLGIFGIIFLIFYGIYSIATGGRSSSPPVYYSPYSPNPFFYSDLFLWWWIFSHPYPHTCCPAVSCCPTINMDCGNCNCNSSSNDGGIVGVLLAIVVVIVIVIILIGLVVGLIIFSLVVVGICQRHYSLLKKKDEVKAFIVKDLFDDRNNQVFIKGKI